MAGCLSASDPDQARICRAAIPALEAPGARISVTAASPAGERAVRIAYRAETPPDAVAERAVTCRFAPSLGRRPDLVGITTPEGEVAGATLYLLKRFYIDTPDGLAGSPGAGDRIANLPVLPEPVAIAGSHLIGGLPKMAIYGLLAAAYALVFGLVGRVNLAFGPILSVGAASCGLAALAAGGATGWAVAAGLAAAAAAAGLHNAVLGRIAFSAVPGGAGQASLIATVGLALALSEYLRLAGGAKPPWMAPLAGDPLPVARAGAFVLTLSPGGILVAAAGAAVGIALVIALRRTGYGRAWRAAADDPLAAALSGIDPAALLVGTLLLSGALAGFAGGLMAVQFGALGFADGFPLALKALAAAILGGIGSVEGALAGGLAVGLFETLWSAALPIEGRDMALFAVLIGAVILLPDGLAGAWRARAGGPG